MHQGGEWKGSAQGLHAQVEATNKPRTLEAGNWEADPSRLQVVRS